MMFNSQRLKLARERRGMTKKNLAELSGITTRTLSTYENAGFLESIDKSTLNKVASALAYPIEFFFQDNLELLQQNGVSFRAMTKLSATKRDAALSAGSIALELNDWIESKFSLLNHDLLDFSKEKFAEPEISATLLREYWGLGELSISNMIHLLESKGIRVFSLAENCLDVDAFSFWLDEKPFIFLNTMKTSERSRFDAAHELGHLVLHKHSSNNGREAEEQADKFASAFLMPAASVTSTISEYPQLDDLIKLKKKWKVSLAALIRRTFDLNISTEWHYRQLNIALSRKYGRTKEPEGMEHRETSLILAKVFDALRQKGFKRSELLKELKLPLDELRALTFDNNYFGLELISKVNNVIESKKSEKSTTLKIVN